MARSEVHGHRRAYVMHAEQARRTARGQRSASNYRCNVYICGKDTGLIIATILAGRYEARTIHCERTAEKNNKSLCMSSNMGRETRRRVLREPYVIRANNGTRRATSERRGLFRLGHGKTETRTERRGHPDIPKQKYRGWRLSSWHVRHQQQSADKGGSGGHISSTKGRVHNLNTTTVQLQGPVKFPCWGREGSYQR
jgi:hypothetical protein